MARIMHAASLTDETHCNRRVVRGAAPMTTPPRTCSAGALAAALPGPPGPKPGQGPKMVVVGGGFGGAILPPGLSAPQRPCDPSDPGRIQPRLRRLPVQQPEVVAGLREMGQQQFGLRFQVAADGVAVIHATVSLAWTRPPARVTLAGRHRRSPGTAWCSAPGIEHAPSTSRARLQPKPRPNSCRTPGWPAPKPPCCADQLRGHAGWRHWS